MSAVAMLGAMLLFVLLFMCLVFIKCVDVASAAVVLAADSEYTSKGSIIGVDAERAMEETGLHRRRSMELFPESFDESGNLRILEAYR